MTAGGLSADGTEWIPPKNPAFLVPVQALSVIFRAKVCAGLRRAGFLDHVPPTVWTTPWVVHVQHAGRGQQVLDYLGRYVFRVAISNSRLAQVGDEHVTFRYRDHRTQEARRVTLTGVDFLGRFLRHVLPRGCAKVRYYGLWSAARRADLARAGSRVPTPIAPSPQPAFEPAASPRPCDLPRCPHCQQGHLIVIAVLRPQRKVPP